MLVDLKDDRPCAVDDGLPEVAACAETHIALGIRTGYRDKGDIRAEFSLPIQKRNQAESNRHKGNAPRAVLFPLVVAEVNALIAEGLSLRIGLEDCNFRSDDQTAAHSHTADGTCACGKRVVQKFGKTAAETVVDIITVPHGGDSLRGRDISCCSRHIVKISFFYCQNSGKAVESQRRRLAEAGISLTKVNKSHRMLI